MTFIYIIRCVRIALRKQIV